MTHERPYRAMVFALLLGCASGPTRAPRAVEARPTATPPAEARLAPSLEEAPVRRAPTEVTGAAPEALEFNITGSSDLPVEPVSAVQPYQRIVDRAVAPARAALAECLRPLGAPARRVVRVSIDESGALHPRPPQEYVLGARDASCVDGVLRALTVEPPPPRVLPYDLRVDVPR